MENLCKLIYAHQNDKIYCKTAKCKICNQIKTCIFFNDFISICPTCITNECIEYDNLPNDTFEIINSLYGNINPILNPIYWVKKEKCFSCEQEKLCIFFKNQYRCIDCLRSTNITEKK